MYMHIYIRGAERDGAHVRGALAGRRRGRPPILIIMLYYVILCHVLSQD